MKKTVFALIMVILVLASAFPVGAGNGTPTGAHYDLNIIGVPKGKTADMTGNNGHRIFVPLWESVKINLSAGPFQVLDANGTDGIAAFQLPVPSACDAFAATCTVNYTVWIRALGKPSGSASMKTCAVDSLGVTYCSDPTWVVSLVRKAGKTTFTNVSSKLLFLSVQGGHFPLFDATFNNYYWQYDNTGLKLAQIRFYMGDYTITW